MIEFFVPGIAVTQGNKIAGQRKDGTQFVREKGGAKLNNWRSDIVKFAHIAYQGVLLDGAIECHMIFFRERPKSHYRTGKNSHILRDDAPKYPTTKPDCTKLCRAAEDALTGVIWTDDARVINQLNAKRYGQPGVRITIKTAE